MPAPDRPTTSRDDLAGKRLLKSALAYSDLGWSIFPLWHIVAAGSELACACPRGPACGSAGKHPRTQRGVHDASADAKQIRSWWRRWPLANIGLACKPSGLIVVDVDPRNGGDTTLAALLAEHGEMPPTVRATSGGGGPHYLFRRPVDGDGTPLARVKSGTLGQGIDVKADGGYIVVAPSQHVSGGTYSWAVSPRDAPPAELPVWIRDKLDTRSPISGVNGTAAAGFLGAAFAAAGWMGRSIGADRAAVRCPWEDGHSTGARYDSSTVVFGPVAGSRVGAFFCSHGSCAARALADVIAALPAPALATARQRLGLPADWMPGSNGAPAPPPADMTPGGEPAGEDSWQHQLVWRTDKEGRPRLTTDGINVALLLTNAPEWDGALVEDRFARAITVVRPLPPVAGLAAPQPGELAGAKLESYIRAWMRTAWHTTFAREAVIEGITLAATAHPRHPLQEYLASLTWDGNARLDLWLANYLGAEPSDYHRLIGRWWMVGAVARALEPGCQADHMLVFEGPQGCGKSSACRILAGDWFLPSLPDLRTKDAAIALAGRWIAEVPELDAMRAAEVTTIKEFLTRTTDLYRPPYGRQAERFPRSCVFIGSTNNDEYLRDTTGGRRFWPIRVVRLDRAALVRDRDQLWAEAVGAYRVGEPWWPAEHAHDLLAEEQDARRARDEWEGVVAEFVIGKDEVTVGDVLTDALRVERDRWTPADQARVARALRLAGFARARPRGAAAGRPRVWKRRSDSGCGE